MSSFVSEVYRTDKGENFAKVCLTKCADASSSRARLDTTEFYQSLDYRIK